MNKLTFPCGPSLGWFDAKLTNSAVDQRVVLEESGSTAFEKCWDKQRIPSTQALGLDLSNEIAFASLHLPGFAELTPEERAANISNMCAVLQGTKYNALTLHPDEITADVCAQFSKRGYHVSVENMDRAKTIGRLPEEFIEICRVVERPAVIDVQHAYENSMDKYGNPTRVAQEIAYGLAQQGIKLTHLHVSGELLKGGKQLEVHSSLTSATNRVAILDAVRLVQKEFGGQVPIILEGDYFSDLSYEIPKRTKGEIADLIARAASDLEKQIDIIGNAT